MKKRLMSLILSAAAVVSVLPASAGVTTGVDQTFGTENYRGTKANASFDITERLYIAPSFSLYRSDISSGTHYNVGARVGYEAGPLSFGVQGGIQPKVNGYKQSSLGGDATFSLAPGGTEHGLRLAGPASEGGETFGCGLAGVDFGAAVTLIMHSDDFSATGPRVHGRRLSGPPRPKTFAVGQTDFTAFAGAKFLAAVLSASATKSHYDKSLDGTDARVAQALSLSGLDAVVQGFPDLSWDLKVEWKTLPLVRPYVSYTHTTFKLGDAPSKVVEIGGVVGLDMLSAKAGWERYTQSGRPDLDYFTVGASLNF